METETVAESIPARTTKSRARVAALAAVPAQQRGLGAFIPDLKADAASNGVMMLIRVDSIDESKNNARTHHDKAGIEALAKSIRSEGLINPIIVKGRGPKWQVVAGHRRLRAYKLLGLESIPAIPRNDLEEVDVRVARAVENLQRSNLSELEEARAFAAAIDSGLSHEALAGRVGVSVSTIRTRLKLLRLPERVASLVGRGWFTQTHALDVLAPLADHAELLDAVVDAVGLDAALVENDFNRCDAYAFQNLVVKAVTASRNVMPIDWRVDTAMAGATKSQTKALKDLPRLKIGSTEFVLDKPAARAIIKEVAAAKTAERAELKTSSPNRPAYNAEFERRVGTEVSERFLNAASKASRGIISFGPRERIFALARSLEGLNTWNTKRKSSAAELMGITVADLNGFPSSKSVIALATRLEKDDVAYARALVGCELHSYWGQQGDYGVGGELSLEWLGTNKSTIEKQARKDLKAEDRAAEKALMVKPSKSKTVKRAPGGKKRAKKASGGVDS